MGGRGSGRWLRLNAKATTEQFFSLDVNMLVRDGMVRVGMAGVLYWLDERIGCRVASATCSTWSSDNNTRIFEIAYRWNECENIRTQIRLQSTSPTFSGARWWFTCPLSSGDISCSRRVVKLYVRDGLFGCRHCHDLTYSSCQQSRERQRLCEQLGVPTIKWLRLAGFA